MNESGKKLRIAVDAMGGDHAPGEIVKGVVQAAAELPVEIILAGPEESVNAALAETHVGTAGVRVVDAPQLIEEGDEPAFAVVRKPNCGVVVAAKLVKRGEADAMISAGPTGAAMVAGLMSLGTLGGIERPMAGGPFVGLAPKTVVMDLGANIGCQPHHLVEFAVAGTVYARTFLDVAEPTVGLLNVGSEKGKGNEVVKEAYGLLEKSGLRFIGNVEGMDIVRGKANVIVCDGFVGNILVKFSESLGRGIGVWLAGELESIAGAEAAGAVTKKLRRILSPGEAVGGGPLIGVNGVVMVAHGASDAAQIAGTVRQTIATVESGFVSRLGEELDKVKGIIEAGRA